MSLHELSVFFDIFNAVEINQLEEKTFIRVCCKKLLGVALLVSYWFIG
jgi:hypothetical protein